MPAERAGFIELVVDEVVPGRERREVRIARLSRYGRGGEDQRCDEQLNSYTHERRGSNPTARMAGQLSPLGRQRARVVIGVWPPLFRGVIERQKHSEHLTDTRAQY